MKQLFFMFVITAMFVVFVPMRPVHAAGADDLVSCPDFSAVYYIGDDGYRYVFPNENIYYSWYSDFSEVKTVSCDDLANFPIGGRLVYRPGTSLVKIPSDPSVYAVESDGVLREIPDEDTAKTLFGDDWSERVDDVSEAFWPSFTLGEPLQEGEVPEGVVLEDEDGNLFRVNDDGTAIEVDTVLDTDDEEVLETYALSLEDIQIRLGVAIALTQVDSEAAIAVLEQLLADLKPMHVDDDKIEDVDEVDEIDDEDGDQDDAEDAIEDAKEEIAEAERDIAEDKVDGKDTTESEALIVSAQDHLALAVAAHAIGDFAGAEEHADEARHDAMWARGKAVDHIREDESGEDDEDSDTDEEEVSDEDDDSDDASSGSSDDSGEDGDED